MTTTDDTTETPETPAQEQEVDAAALLAGMSIPDQLEKALAKAVPAELAALAKSIAKTAVAEMVTAPIRAELAESARHRVEVTLNTDPVEETGEPGGDGTEGEADEEATPEPLYPDVREFVEQHVAMLYRRDAHKVGSRFHWCPQWWRHGEVLDRFRALHAAFEKLRLGVGVEQAVFWVTYFDPMMDRILDPEGPFKYCSMAEGHQRRDGRRDGFGQMMVVRAPDSIVAADRDGVDPDPSTVEADAPAGFATTASGLYYPAVRPRRTRAVRDFPDGQPF
ncbi:DUF4913 domain-containing protein [Nocardia thailandica]|uniref:DUF4913 domain-containing protein n=1 Tax=Nocardia thailandica TaxID=257275 RepID=A0ABW6PWP8_9NOCA